MIAIGSLPTLAAYLIQAVVLITAGIILASIIAETGVFSRLTRVSRPLCRVCGLSEPCVVCVLAMVVNATAGKSMLAEYFRDEKVRREEVIPALLMGTFPAVLGESLFRVQLPTALVLLGPVVGTLHTLFNLFSSFLQTLAAIAFSHIFLRTHLESLIPAPDEKPLSFSAAAVKQGFFRAIPTLRRVLPATVAATLVFSVLWASGGMDVIAAIFDPLLHLVGLPGESSAALVAQFVHFSAGYAIVGSLMIEGVLILKTALITLVIGSMIIITSIYIKYTGPLYLSLFGRYGVRVTLVTYGASMGAKLVTIALIMAFF
ncbi:nucleoside recognition protein [Methanoculleus sp. FWC-SCC1]|uniref:Nucleoside recognition protein n=1 Tax=Methanoculleus frigidifontis TaxID=2584085 RepID=A0ABT8M801_9EURY|nr:nucleoside recognition domain-containing protein [Methanoculleus sp. FWC-SCC1]MDN7024058.1 nucleoside recognition protein [Methanoculleus sp. FWC-SCC1]